LHIGVPFVALLRIPVVKEKSPEMVMVMMTVKLIILKFQSDDGASNYNDKDNADDGIEAEVNLQSDV